MSELSNIREQFNSLREIGIALSKEKNIKHLLTLIVESAETLTKADGGTLYTLNEAHTHLDFQIVRNTSLNVNMGGISEPITWPAVPLEKDGQDNLNNVSTAAAIQSKTINIADVYEEEGYDFSGTKAFDKQTGYRSCSMIVVPLHDHLNNTIGVLQLLNAKDQQGKNIAFDSAAQSLVESLASQAAVAITNTQLVQDLKKLLEAFVKSIASAVDAKSKYTGDHINRVTVLTNMIAAKMAVVPHGPYKDITFSDAQLEEIRIAALLHDVGKIITPEHVVDKSTKLETVIDGIKEIDLRFEIMKKDREIAALKKALGKTVAIDVSDIETDQAFVQKTNQGGEFMTDEAIERIDCIAKRTYRLGENNIPILNAAEIENLKIRKGTLNPEERQIIEDHAKHTITMLNALPFPSDMSRVPEIAGGHHEKLDGSGYPNKLTAEQLSTPARILAVADIFEALTARDRPYKKPMSLSQAVKIMGFMIKDNHLDGDIFHLFVTEGLLDDYASTHLADDQIDSYKYPF